MPSSHLRGRESYLRYVSMFFEAFPDLHTKVLDITGEGRLMAARLRNTGTHEGEIMGIPASGRAIDLEVGHFTRHNNNGEITEEYVYLDQLVFMQQLGVMAEAATT